MHQHVMAQKLQKGTKTYLNGFDEELVKDFIDDESDVGYNTRKLKK